MPTHKKSEVMEEIEGNANQTKMDFEAMAKKTVAVPLAALAALVGLVLLLFFTRKK